MANDTVFKALADPNRRRILKILQKGSRNAGDIAAHFDITNGSMSHHFNILKRAELIRCERRGTEMVYSLNTTVFEDVSTMLLDLFQHPKEKDQ